MPDRIKRLNSVIQTEATTTSTGDFLITHAPFTSLYLDNVNKIDEEELLENYLLSDNDSHKLLMIQGGNGSGKSHLIRWLKEKYEAHTERNEEAILFISRAHNNLQDALRQLLESGVFPDDIKDETLRILSSARGSRSESDFKKLINFNFQLAVENDCQDNSRCILDQLERKRLSRYLANPYIIDKYLMADDGPLDKMRAKIETTDSAKVADGDAPVFTPEDFHITIAHIKEGLLSTGRKAEDSVIRFAEKLEKPANNEFRCRVASYLNTKVSMVIRESMDLKTIDFQRIFEDLRIDLKRRNMKLTLFIEDINAFTGIDEVLMEALLTDHKAIGNQDCCRLNSVVGSTIWFYENKLNSSIRQRIKANFYLREGSVLTESNIGRFAARYINAINQEEKSVANWYKFGARNEDIPTAPVEYEFAAVDIDSKDYSIFPFTETALIRLYNSLDYNDENNSYRTPRVFLQEVMQQILMNWYREGNDFLSNEANFVGTHFRIPDWADYTHGTANRTNELFDEDSVTQRGILLRIWGDGTTEAQGPQMIGGVSKEIFDAFGVPFPDEYCSGTRPINQEKRIIQEVLPTPNAVQPSISPKLLDLEKEISDWAIKNAALNSHQDLRDWLAQFILAYYHWEIRGIPYKLASSYISRRFLFIEGQPAAMQAENYIKLERNTETQGLLIALARWKYLGNNSWEFVNCPDYITMAFSWLEKNSDLIYRHVVESAEVSTIEKYEYLSVYALYLIRSIREGVNIDQPSSKIAIDLFQSPVSKEVRTSNQSADWKALSVSFGDTDTYVNSLAMFKKVVGGTIKEDTSYMFVDMQRIIERIDEIKANKWEIPELAKRYKENEISDIKKCFAVVIQDYADKEKDIFNKEHTLICELISYFGAVLPANYSESDIHETISGIQSFLEFVRETLNGSYAEADYQLLKTGSIKNLYDDLLELKDISKLGKGPEFLSRISFSPYENAIKFKDAFVAFEKMMNEKEQSFRSQINDSTSKQIQAYQCVAKKSVDDMLQLCNSSGEEDK